MPKVKVIHKHWLGQFANHVLCKTMPKKTVFNDATIDQIVAIQSKDVISFCLKACNEWRADRKKYLKKLQKMFDIVHDNK